MNKAELLAIAARRPSVSKVALKLASQSLGDTEIEKRHKPAKRLAAASTVGMVIGAAALFVTLARRFFDWLYANHEPMVPGDEWIEAVTFGGLGAGMLTLAFIATAQLVMSITGIDKRALMLGSLGDSLHNVAALRAFKEGGPAAQAWRDIALTERSELRVYDFAVMEALAYVHTEQASAVRRRQLAEYECRKLHGVPTNS